MPAMATQQEVLANALRLAQAAATLGVPVWGTEQNPDKLGPNAPALRTLCNKTLSKMAFSGVHEGLLEVLRSPAPPPAGNARSLPRHLKKPSTFRRGPLQHCGGWLRNPRVSAADGAGVAGGVVRRLGGDRRLQFPHPGQPRCGFRPPGQRRRRACYHGDGFVRMVANGRSSGIPGSAGADQIKVVGMSGVAKNAPLIASMNGRGADAPASFVCTDGQ